MNDIRIMGRFARDPEYTDQGTPRVNFSVGVDRRSTRDGDKTDWFRCVAWDGDKVKTATQIRDYFKKGKPIILYGRMENDPYTDKDGRLRDSWAFKVERWEFVLSDPTQRTNTAPKPYTEMAPEPQPNTYGDSFKAAEDDIPF